MEKNNERTQELDEVVSNGIATRNMNGDNLGTDDQITAAYRKGVFDGANYEERKQAETNLQNQNFYKQMVSELGDILQYIITGDLEIPSVQQKALSTIAETRAHFKRFIITE